MCLMPHSISFQDYDTAKLLKQAETQLRSLGQQLAKLEVAKREAVEDEDYDRAKMLKVRSNERQRNPTSIAQASLGEMLMRRRVDVESWKVLVTTVDEPTFFTYFFSGGSRRPSFANRGSPEPAATSHIGNQTNAGALFHNFWCATARSRYARLE